MLRKGHPRIMNRSILAALAVLALPAMPSRAQDPSRIRSVDVPPVAREMRGLWVATVGNMDWPSRKDLTTAQQKSELVAIFDRAKAVGFNAIIFQVRPAGDALYASSLEPWSEYLTGTMGKAPEPYYDPLAFAVEEAHKRGMELHAWFNPYRARYPGAKSPLAPSHLGVRRPELVKPYGRHLWMDPGEDDVRRHSLAVMLDVVRRYNVDGIHLDDYFYPYQERDAEEKTIPFPDDASWAKYRAKGGTLSRDDWRRNNVDTLLDELYAGTKRLKPWVQVGISPFGIWRPGYPKAIQGLDPYAVLYADSRKWLRNGWLDYFTPQLYWAVSRPAQSYPVLLAWWAEQNVKGRSLWPGNILSHPAEEITDQVIITRRQAGATGNIHFNASSLMRNRNGTTDALAALYAEPALIPASPWLDDAPPAGVEASLARSITPATGPNGSATVRWAIQGAERPALWVLQIRAGGQWKSVILPAAQTAYDLGGANAVGPGDRIAVSAVDRSGNQSLPSVLTVDERLAAPVRGGPNPGK